ncbi:MAG TPA: flagellar regulator YcgR PilZN domain-containing protein [Albitalea sp.]|uniref:flagellar brake protein n=1 Tax=Piscinibacter sp. TaxID=1903157 RepID=UPI002ED0FEB8
MGALDPQLDDFRVTSPAEIGAMLRRLADDHVHLSLNAPNGTSITATLWTVDARRGLVSFSMLPDEMQLDALVECDEAMVVAYLDSIKLQFDVHDLVLVHRGNEKSLNGAFPQELFRFQRRNGFRVEPMLRSTPVARLRHPMIPDMQLALRVLDVSIGGCALFLPNDVPPLDPGVLMNGAVIDLDADTRVHTGLRLQHVTSLNPESGGVRLGCEMVAPGSDGLRALQRYIDQTQKRRRLLIS